MRGRLVNGWRRFAIERFARRDFQLPGETAYVSFTFDDFPRTALSAGGRILEEHGVRGTYFVSMGLLDTVGASGAIATRGDLEDALAAGHELGCHTYDHVDGSVVNARAFARSIEANRRALADAGIGASLDVFAYPLNGPAVATKRAAGERFVACRGGGQTFNRDVIDLTLLKAYFVDARSRSRLEEMSRLIEANAAARGWLIFATHDVADEPSEYGCTPAQLAALVTSSVAAGSVVLPMAAVAAEAGVVAGTRDHGLAERVH